VPGSFAYTPGPGEVLAWGTHTLTANFSPADSAGYTTAQATVLITVTKAVPVIQWESPEPIEYGTGLSGTQLNASASVPGEFVYTPALGEVLAAGRHTLTVTFNPAEAEGYTAAQATVLLEVKKARPTVQWTAPAAITYGNPLSEMQLSATASVQGDCLHTGGGRGAGGGRTDTAGDLHSGRHGELLRGAGFRSAHGQ
jgi:hypothetical protein